MRAAALDHVHHRLAEQVDEAAHLITAESSKADMWAKVEVRWSISTFRWVAEEAQVQ